MPQATRLPFASRTGVHTQAGRRSPRKTGSPVTALKTWLGFVLYLRNVTPWKEHLNYKRPGPPGCLLAQAGPQPGGRPGARPLPEPGACVPGPAPLRLCAPEAGHPGTHTPASPRGLAKHSTNRSSAAAAPRHGTLRAQRPLCPPPSPRSGTSFQMHLGQVFAVGFRERQSWSPGFGAGAEPALAQPPVHHAGYSAAGVPTPGRGPPAPATRTRSPPCKTASQRPFQTTRREREPPCVLQPRGHPASGHSGPHGLHARLDEGSGGHPSRKPHRVPRGENPAQRPAAEGSVKSTWWAWTWGSPKN